MKQKYPSIFLFLILFFWINDVGFSQVVTLSKTLPVPQNITESIEIFEDSTARLSLAQVTGKSFQKSTKNHFIFPYTNAAFWVRFTMKNTDAPQKNWFLLWSNPLVEQLDFYISDSTRRHFLHTQQKILTTQKDKKLIDQDPKFAFELGPQQTKTVYIKLTSKRGHYGSIRIHSAESYYKARLEDYSGQGFFNGLVIFRLFLVISLSLFVIKDLPFRLYSLHTVIKTFAFWGYLNIAGPLFTDDPDVAKKVDFLFYNSITMGSGLFILFTLAINKLPKWNSFLIGGILAFTAFDGIIVFFDYQWYWLKAGLYSIVFSAIYFILLYIYCLIRQISIGKYYAVPFILGLISYFLLYVRLLGWIEYQPIYSIAYLLFVGEIFVFVIFLGRIFRNAEVNKRLAEQKLSFNIEQAARLKELDTLKTNFFANISHEFRTPLTLILSPLRELRTEFPQRDIFRTMQQNAERLLSLINQLLDLSKLEAGQMTVDIRHDDLAKFLRQIFASFESLAQSKHIIFQYEQSHTSRIAYFDADKMEKIVTNLLSNAFKFTPQSGRVEVQVIFTEASVVLKVKDSGIGISSEMLPKIFNRFYQAEHGNNRNFEGTGIGLALVKELTEALQGTINVASRVEEGTLFTVTLPCDAATWQTYHKENPDPVESADDTGIFTKNSVFANGAGTEDKVTLDEHAPILLIVEDNPDLRDYIGSLFKGSYRILKALDGQDGLNKAIETIPDIVICDLMMPRLDGFGFCEALKSDLRTNHIPVIMLTAKATVEDRLEGLGKGADDYLAKPFHSNELQLRVRNLLKQRQLIQQKYSQPSAQLQVSAKVTPSPDDEFLQKVNKTMADNLADSTWDVEQFASVMAMTSVQLRRKLKALTNQTVTEYVRNYRLEKAAELLRNKTGTISEIAYLVGFESLPYFSKVFSDKFGVPPSEYSVIDAS